MTVRDLIAQRDHLLELVRQRRLGTPFRHCNYCGAPCLGLTCRAHADLPALDPYYNEAADKTEPSEPIAA